MYGIEVWQLWPQAGPFWRRDPETGELELFGTWEEAARRLDAENLEDGDLVHLDEEAIREDVLELLATYNWHFGAGNYLLARREINPAKLSEEAVS